jgi:hypothetical protein
MRKMMAMAVTASFMASAAFAAADFRITEAYTGVSGSDGTADWFEITNFGDMAGTLDGLFYDDDSADPTNNYALPALTLAPLESAVVLIDTDPGDVAVFEAFWGLSGSGVQVGVTGGGSLSQGGDAVYVFESNLPGAAVVDSLIYGSGLGGTASTIEDVTGFGPLTLSQVGVNGAFLSVGNAAPGKLIGSPGVIPEPASLMLLGLGAVALLRRR